MAARTSTSSGDPMLCTVVKPAASVMYAFSASHDRLRRRFAAARRPAVRAEVRVEVDVRVDQAGQDREAAQVVGGGAALALADADDLAVADDDRRRRNGAAGAVERGRGSDGDGACLRAAVVAPSNAMATKTAKTTRRMGAV
mgnify:CR=1 FL=1